MNLKPFVVLLAVVALCHAFPVSGWSAEPAGKIDLRQHAPEIRALLLRSTPIGASTDGVLAFVGKHLPADADRAVKLSDGPVAAPEKTKPRGAKFLRVYLGEYYDHPEVVFLTAPILMERQVRAIWIFDARNRLLDLVVEKKTGTY